MFIVGDMRPISVVEGQYFRELISYVEPNYDMPSRRTFGLRIEELFAMSKEKLKYRLADVDNTLVTFDAWTNIKMESFMGVTGHYIDEHFKLHSCLLSCNLLDDRYTTQNYVTWIEDVPYCISFV